MLNFKDVKMTASAVFGPNTHHRRCLFAEETAIV